MQKLGQFALRTFWEVVSLLGGLLLGIVPVVLIAGAIAWAAADPGCSCYSQKVVIAKVKIEESKTIVLAVAGVASVACWLLMRRLKFSLRHLVDFLFCLCVFGGVYFVVRYFAGDAPTPLGLTKVPLQTLAPVQLQQGFIVEHWSEPYFFPWKALYLFIDSWSFVAGVVGALACFVLFGESGVLSKKTSEVEPPATGAEGGEPTTVQPS